MANSAPRPPASEFRKRFLARQTVVGTFIKTPAPQTIEVLGDMGFDFVVIDGEHAPFDRTTTGYGLLAARASGTAGIVRVPDATASTILSVLDDGATGVLVPHVSSVETAQDVVAACRYRGGKRGFANTTRAGRYGAMGFAEHTEAQDSGVTVIAMIEDPEALDVIDDIVAVDGIDGFFVGRGDLTAAFQAPGMDAPVVRQAAEKIIKAVTAAGKTVCIMVGGKAEAEDFASLGASAFIVSSDHGFMRQAAGKALADMAELNR
ncbi:HpcH/HpaI aldolase family protein [Microbaculum marinum]|uniref:Aldolase/citrate lyase family protein n=1 Tax=Microbaculum marinum TaxID=1764581 RepID=A0AAW9RTF4_9HYPH